MFSFEQLSGANVTLVEDRPDVTQKIIQISGTPEQAERAQSLLQGFILSSKSSLNVLGVATLILMHTLVFFLVLKHPRLRIKLK